jgi:hypothetical protein
MLSCLYLVATMNNTMKLVSGRVFPFLWGGCTCKKSYWATSFWWAAGLPSPVAWLGSGVMSSVPAACLVCACVCTHVPGTTRGLVDAELRPYVFLISFDLAGVKWSLCGFLGVSWWLMTGSNVWCVYLDIFFEEMSMRVLCCFETVFYYSSCYFCC